MTFGGFFLWQMSLGRTYPTVDICVCGGIWIMNSSQMNVSSFFSLFLFFMCKLSPLLHFACELNTLSQTYDVSFQNIPENTHTHTFARTSHKHRQNHSNRLISIGVSTQTEQKISIHFCRFTLKFVCIVKWFTMAMNIAFETTCQMDKISNLKKREN